MFDLAWSELAVVGLVAVLVLGPKELPQAMRTMAKVMRKMRGLTAELQGHMNEIVRQADLDEVRQSIQKFSTTNLSSEVAKAVDPTGELTAQLNAPMAPEAASDGTGGEAVAIAEATPDQPPALPPTEPQHPAPSSEAAPGPVSATAT
ncbi:MAG: twin-arginine translocase subunit TatB [Rhodospirillaceae bacterium]|nr:twin-arginine translocase subunit TatB [Rhodospirillaceae bacterium]